MGFSDSAETVDRQFTKLWLRRTDSFKSTGELYFKTFQQNLSKSSPLATNPPGQLNILGHDGHPLGVDGAQVGVLEETHQVGLAGLLKSHHSRALEPQVSLEILGNLTNEPLEWQLPDEELRGLLVPRGIDYLRCI